MVSFSLFYPLLVAHLLVRPSHHHFLLIREVLCVVGYVGTLRSSLLTPNIPSWFRHFLNSYLLCRVIVPFVTARDVHFIIRMMGKLRAKIGNVLDRLNLREYVHWQPGRLFRHPNCLLFMLFVAS